MADYVKQLDNNHLLTVGLDGFYESGTRSWINPRGAGQWAEQVALSIILFLHHLWYLGLFCYTYHTPFLSITSSDRGLENGIDIDNRIVLAQEECNSLCMAVKEKRHNRKSYGCCNPQEGQDFVEDHMSSSIDFSTFHCWMDNWGDPTEEFLRRWISEHVADAKAMHKPILLQEFGNKVQQDGPTAKDREKFFAVVYEEVEKSMKSGPLMGALFWQW